MIELYHWEPVGHSLRALICLEEIGVEYRGHYVDLLEFEQFGADFLALNRAGQVPVLRNNGVTMTESSLISQYLAERFPDAGLAPADPLGWYSVQTWSKFVDYNLGPSLATLGCRRYLTPMILEGDAEAMREAVESIPVETRRRAWRAVVSGDYPEEQVANSERKVELVIRRMEDILAGADWLVGNRYSIADVDTFAMIHGLRDVAAARVNDELAPGTGAWYERIAGRAAVQAALATPSRYPAKSVYAPGPEHSRWG